MRLQSEKIEGIEAVVQEDNARYFKVIIDGPKEVWRPSNFDSTSPPPS